MIIEGLKLSKRQLDIYRSIVKSSNTAKFHIINASRQSGKTTIAIQLLLNFAINGSRLRIMFISPTHNNNRKIYKTIVNRLKDSGIIKNNDKSNLEITLDNDTEILFRSAEKYDNIRGESIDYLFIDEFAFMREIAWTTAIKPLTAARGSGKVVIMSTPRGKNHFYQLVLLGKQQDSDRYTYYEMSYLDNPYYDLNEVDDAKKTLPDGLFRQEYLAEFIDNNGDVFGDFGKVCTIDDWSYNSSMQYYAGLDFGRTVDSTVLTIIDKYGHVAYIYAIKQQSWDYIFDELLKVLNKYKPYVYVEANTGTINDPLYERLLKVYNKISAFNTTNSSKSDLIESLILAINDDKIKLPTEMLCEPLSFQMSAFTYKYSNETRRVKYAAPQGLNDDYVISLAIANKAYNDMKNVGKISMVRPDRSNTRY